MTKIFLIAFLLLIGTVSCKNTKNAQTDVLTEQEQKDKMRRDALRSNPLKEVEINSEELEKEAELAEEEQDKNEFPDSLVARIQRTPCYGNCPVYTISIYNTGFATYEGKNFVENEGYYGAYVSRNVLSTLQDMAREIGFMELQDRYDTPGMTDVPSTITSLRIDGKLKTVVNRDGGPKKLEEFEAFFDSLFDEVDWDNDFKDPNAKP